MISSWRECKKEWEIKFRGIYALFCLILFIAMLIVISNNYSCKLWKMLALSFFLLFFFVCSVIHLRYHFLLSIIHYLFQHHNYTYLVNIYLLSSCNSKIENVALSCLYLLLIKINYKKVCLINDTHVETLTIFIS